MSCLSCIPTTTGAVRMRFNLHAKVIEFNVHPTKDTVESIMAEYLEHFECIHGRPYTDQDTGWKAQLQHYFPKKVGRLLVVTQPTR